MMELQVDEKDYFFSKWTKLFVLGLHDMQVLIKMCYCY